MIRIGYNHDTDRKFGNLIVVLKKNFSSVSARKLKRPSSARKFHSLGSLEPENSSSNSSLLLGHALEKIADNFLKKVPPGWYISIWKIDFWYFRFAGPDAWHNNFPVATEGKRQSPIDIETSKIIDGSSVTSSKPLTWNYQLDHCLNIENTGASWKVNVNGTGSCKFVFFKRKVC